MDIKKIGVEFFNSINPIDLPNEDKLEDSNLNDQKKTEIFEKEKRNKKSLDEDEEDPYDLDLNIKESIYQHNFIEPGLSGRQCGPQSQWPRCSNGCQTQRGHTCPSCDTQQARQTCIRC